MPRKSGAITSVGFSTIFPVDPATSRATQAAKPRLCPPVRFSRFFWNTRPSSEEEESANEEEDDDNEDEDGQGGNQGDSRNEDDNQHNNQDENDNDDDDDSEEDKVPKVSTVGKPKSSRPSQSPKPSRNSLASNILDPNRSKPAGFANFYSYDTTHTPDDPYTEPNTTITTANTTARIKMEPATSRSPTPEDPVLPLTASNFTLASLSYSTEPRRLPSQNPTLSTSAKATASDRSFSSMANNVPATGTRASSLEISQEAQSLLSGKPTVTPSQSSSNEKQVVVIDLISDDDEPQTASTAVSQSRTVDSGPNMPPNHPSNRTRETGRPANSQHMSGYKQPQSLLDSRRLASHTLTPSKPPPIRFDYDVHHHENDGSGATSLQESPQASQQPKATAAPAEKLPMKRARDGSHEMMGNAARSHGLMLQDVAKRARTRGGGRSNAWDDRRMEFEKPQNKSSISPYAQKFAHFRDGADRANNDGVDKKKLPSFNPINLPDDDDNAPASRGQSGSKIQGEKRATEGPERTYAPPANPLGLPTPPKRKATAADRQEFAAAYKDSKRAKKNVDLNRQKTSPSDSHNHKSAYLQALERRGGLDRRQDFKPETKDGRMSKALCDIYNALAKGQGKKTVSRHVGNAKVVDSADEYVASLPVPCVIRLLRSPAPSPPLLATPLPIVPSVSTPSSPEPSPGNSLKAPKSGGAKKGRKRAAAAASGKRPNKIVTVPGVKPSNIVFLYYNPANLTRSMRRRLERRQDPSIPIDGKCFLLDSPLEVREIIYRQLLRADEPIKVLHGWSQVLSRQQINLHPGILSTCDTIYQEAGHILYAENVFRYKLRDDGKMVEFEKGKKRSNNGILPLRQHIGQMRHLELYLEGNRTERDYGHSIQEAMSVLIKLGASNLHTFTLSVSPRKGPNDTVTMVEYFKPAYSITNILKQMEAMFVRVNVFLAATDTVPAKSLRIIVDKRPEISEPEIFNAMDAQEDDLKESLDKEDRRELARQDLTDRAIRESFKQLMLLSSRIETACKRGAVWVMQQGWFQEFEPDEKQRQMMDVDIINYNPVEEDDSDDDYEG